MGPAGVGAAATRMQQQQQHGCHLPAGGSSSSPDAAAGTAAAAASAHPACVTHCQGVCRQRQPTNSAHHCHSPLPLTTPLSLTTATHHCHGIGYQIIRYPWYPARAVEIEDLAPIQHSGRHHPSGRGHCIGRLDGDRAIRNRYWLRWSLNSEVARQLHHGVYSRLARLQRRQQLCACAD